jgi:sulfur carrier protein
MDTTNEMDTTVEVLVNGESVRLPGGASVADVVRHLLPPTEDAPDALDGPDGPVSVGGIAVALGDEVVPAGRWATTVVRDGDRLEVLGAVAGG